MHHIQDRKVEVIVQVHTDHYSELEASAEKISELLTHVANELQEQDGEKCLEIMMNLVVSLCEDK